MDQTLSPEAVEALVKSLTAKMESHKGALGEVTTALMKLQFDNKEDKEKDAVFKTEVRAALASLKMTRVDVPLIAVGLGLVSLIFASIALIGTARASQRLSDEIRDIRDHMVINGRESTSRH